MKTTTLIAFVAVLVAVTVSAISMSTSPIVLATGSSFTQESGSFMAGHVELVVRDSAGNIIQYQQTDNLVTDEGDQCVIDATFQITGTGDTSCTISADGFQFIGISNATHAPSSGSLNGTSTSLAKDGNTDTIAASGAANAGLMAVKKDLETVGADGTDGNTIEIKTEQAFNFISTGTVSKNDTTIKQVGLMDAECITAVGNGTCALYGTNNLFSVQEVTVAVGDGDSLTVTWTITVGDAT